MGFSVLVLLFGFLFSAAVFQFSATVVLVKPLSQEFEVAGFGLVFFLCLALGVCAWLLGL